MMSPSVESNEVINQNINTSIKKQLMCKTEESDVLKSVHPISSRSSVFCIEHLLNSGKHVKSGHQIHHQIDEQNHSKQSLNNFSGIFEFISIYIS